MDILDKFTGHLRDVLAKSYTLAAEIGSPGINPEHLLLALLVEKGSIGGEILRKTGISAEEIRRLLLVTTVPYGDDAPDSKPRISSESKRAIEKAVLNANIQEHKYVGTEHLLAGVLAIDSPSVEAILAEQGIDLVGLKEQVDAVLKSTSKFPEITENFNAGKQQNMADDEESEDDLAMKGIKGGDKKAVKAAAKGKTPALEFFAVELTNAKFQENVDPVIGRDKEVERMVQILCRKTKNNPVLLGEPGVGKTAIVEGLAKMITTGDVPEVLANKRLMSLDLGLMLAGTIYRGEFEGRLKQIVDEVKANSDIILFIDELHMIMGAGATNGSLDAANLLKPALARGDIRCIGATTLAEYKKHIESDGALDRRFQPIIVEQPSAEDAVKILKGLRPNYETYHGVKITDEAIEAAVKLSERFVPDRFLPDKAIDLIDEAAASVRVAATSDNGDSKMNALQDDLEKIQRKKQKAVMGENFIEALELKAKEKDVQHKLLAFKKKDATKAKPVIGSIGRREVAAVISRATGIPLTELVAEEKSRLLNLESHLMKRIVGQDDAVKSVAELVRRAKAGIMSPNRPLASFLFTGPSGVGKTELAKLLAQMVFHSADALIRIDMSEFSEGFSMSKLVGAPAGYVGYKEGAKLTDAIKRKPYAIVLFDEIEKAHGDVHNLLLQILEDGHITDATGKKINFKNTIIVMTSNVGAGRLLEPQMGFSSGSREDSTVTDMDETKATMMKELETAFKPEFLNRIDKVIPFAPLSKLHLESIVAIQIDDLAERLNRDHSIVLTYKPKTLGIIADKSWNPAYGARGVRRQIQELIENPLAKELLADSYCAGDCVDVGVRGGNVVIEKAKVKV